MESRTHLSVRSRGAAALLVMALLALVFPTGSLAAADPTSPSPTQPGPCPTPTEPSPTEPLPTLTPVAGLQGKVTSISGAPLANAEVTVEHRPLRSSQWSTPATVRTQPEGTWFADTPVAYAEYRVSFRHTGHQPQWYQNATRACDAALLYPGATHVDAQLVPLPWWKALCSPRLPPLLRLLLRRTCGVTVG